jgi:hypothetical protein
MTESRDTNYTWKGQLAVGTAGETVVLEWLKSRDFSVLDMRDNADMRDDDIDFLVSSLDGPSFYAEVKTDTYDNEFAFFEVYTAEKNPGALFKSRARVWYIYKTQRGTVVEVEPARVITYLYDMEKRNQGNAYRLYPVFNDKKKIRAWGVRVAIGTLTDLGGMVYLLEDVDAGR